MRTNCVIHTFIIVFFSYTQECEKNILTLYSYMRIVKHISKESHMEQTQSGQLTSECCDAQISDFGYCMECLEHVL